MNRVQRILMDWACEDIQFQLFDWGKNCNRINRRPFTRAELVEEVVDYLDKKGGGYDFSALQIVSELISNPHWEIELEEKEMESVSDKPTEIDGTLP